MCAMPASGDLGLTAQNYGGSHATDSHDVSAVKNTVAGNDGSGAVIRAHYFVDGMTCGHCVASVTEEVLAITGVDSVSSDLNVGGISRITVVSAHQIAKESISTAVIEAGYTLAPGR